MPKVRADQLLVERGLVETRERARRLVMAGQVRSGDRVLVKPATMLQADDPLELVAPDRYVSRGALKLEAALREFAIDVAGLRCLDIGASTGGFTDCMLQHGAASVLAVDVGRAQLHQRLREDRRVTLIDNTNARDLPPLPPVDFVAIDVSFISVLKVLPSVAQRLPAGTPGVVLLKPQFELEPARVPRGGIVREEALRQEVATSLREFLLEHEWTLHALIDCPTAGAEGNVEFLAYVRTPGNEVPEC
jgi:23S rRNA (cytidine1920-2'-O)/16S rRNA (cytidine1409-2'-O)-methyltransferase